MAQSNHSFYEEVKKSDNSEKNSFYKSWKMIRKYSKWALFSFLTVVTLWGCASEFIHVTNQQTSRGLEFYGNKQSVLPNMYKTQKATFSYQILANGDNPVTENDTEDNYLLPFEIYRPNYNYLYGQQDENSSYDNLFISPGKSTDDYQITLLSSIINLTLNPYYSSAFLTYDWTNLTSLQDIDYLIAPFSFDYFSTDVKSKFFEFATQIGSSLVDFDNDQEMGNQNEAVDAVEFYSWLASENSTYADEYNSFIIPKLTDDDGNPIDSNGDEILNGDDYRTSVETGFAYYIGPLTNFSSLANFSGDQDAFEAAYNEVGHVDGSDLLNSANWIPISKINTTRTFNVDDTDNSLLDIYKNEVKIYSNIFAFYTPNLQTTFNSSTTDLSTLANSYTYYFEKEITYDLTYTDKDQTLDDIDINDYFQGTYTLENLLGRLFSGTSPPSHINYQIIFPFLLDPSSLNFNSSLDANLITGTSYSVINAQNVSDPQEVFYPSKKYMQLMTGYNYNNNVYSPNNISYQSEYDYTDDGTDENTIYTNDEGAASLRNSNWISGTKAGQKDRTRATGWAFMELDSDNNWNLVELASNKANADTEFDSNAFLFFANEANFNDSYQDLFDGSGNPNYLINYGQFVSFGYSETDENGDVLEKSFLDGQVFFFNPFIGITSQQTTETGFIDPFVTTTGSMGTAASLRDVLDTAENDGLNNSREIFTSDVGDWQDAWDPAYGPMYGIFVWPLSQLSIFMQNIFPIGAAWGAILGIFIITFLLRGFGYLMSFGSNKNQSKMQEVQTQIAQINAKYQQYDKSNKQMKVRKQQETMALYRKNNINPFASIGTIFVTMPIFLSIWTIISALPAYKIVSVGQFSFSVSALSGMFTVGTLFFAYLFVGIGVGFAQGLSSKLPRMLSNKRKGIKRIDYQTKKAMKKQNRTQNIMIGVFVFMGLIVPVLLAIYWIFSALFSMMTELIKHSVIQYKSGREHK